MLAGLLVAALFACLDKKLVRVRKCDDNDMLVACSIARGCLVFCLLACLLACLVSCSALAKRDQKRKINT